MCEDPSGKENPEILPGLIQHVSPPKVEEDVIDLPEDFTKVIADGLARPDRHKNAAGKKLCGVCAHKAKVKRIWQCTLKGEPFYCPALSNSCGGFSQKSLHKKAPQGKKKCLPVPPGVKFLYVGAPSPGRYLDFGRRVPVSRGVVTVAWTSPAPGTLHLGFSFCSPKDRWCKATGRDMAAARLLKKTGPTLTIPFLYDAKRTVREVVMAVCRHDFGKLEALCPGATAWGHPQVPSWTKNLVNVMKGGTAIFISDFHRIGKRPHVTHAFDALGYSLGISTPWDRMKKALQKDIHVPKPTGAQILAGMMQDIAALRNE